MEVVTFCLHGWSMLGVFLLPAFTPLRHECQEDLLSLYRGMHECTDFTSVYTLIWKGFRRMEAEPMLTPREKSPPLEAQRRIGPTQNHAGQCAQHTTNWVIPAPDLLCHVSQKYRQRDFFTDHFVNKQTATNTCYCHIHIYMINTNRKSSIKVKWPSQSCLLL